MRFLGPAFVLMVVFTFVSGAQPHYPVFLLIVVYAAGVVVLQDSLHHVVWIPLLVVNSRRRRSSWRCRCCLSRCWAGRRCRT